MIGAARSWIVGVAGLVTAACAGDDLLLPGEGEPAGIAIVAGDGQQGRVGQRLADPIEVRVTDAQDRPVAGARVSFVGVDGAAPSLTPESAVTGDDGRAASEVTLPTDAGDVTVEARVTAGGSAGTLSARFTLRAMPGAAARLEQVSGDAQTGTVNTDLAAPLVVRVSDEFGNGVSGIDVAWTAQGGGAVSAASTTTGDDGTGSVTRSLGGRPGSYGTAAAVEGLEGSPVMFTATASTGPSPRLVLATPPSATARNGVPLERQPVIQLEDAQGESITQSGVVVTVQIASGGGALAGTTSRPTDASGRAAFTDLVLTGAAGSRRLIFAADGYAATTSPPIELTAGLPDPDESSVTVDPGTIGASTGGNAATVIVVLRDRLGNPIPGASVSLSASGEGNTLIQPAAATDADGRTSGTFASTRSGTHTITVQTESVTLTDRPEVIVEPGPPNADASAVTVPAGVAGTPTGIAVTLRDEFDNAVSGEPSAIAVAIGGTNAGATVSAPSGGADGRYTVTYTPVVTGTDQVTVRVAGELVPGSPFPSTVEAGPPVAQTTTAEVPPRSCVRATVPIRVITRDAEENEVRSGGAPVTVAIRAGSGQETPLPVTDHGDGTYSASFTAGFSDVDVHVRLDGTPVKDSPYRVDVQLFCTN